MDAHADDGCRGCEDARALELRVGGDGNGSRFLKRFPPCAYVRDVHRHGGADVRG